MLRRNNLGDTRWYEVTVQKDPPSTGRVTSYVMGEARAKDYARWWKGRMASRLGPVSVHLGEYESSFFMITHPSSGEMAVRKLLEIGNPEHRLKVDRNIPLGEAWLVPVELAHDLVLAAQSDRVVVVPGSELTEHDVERLSEKYCRLMGAS